VDGRVTTVHPQRRAGVSRAHGQAFGDVVDQDGQHHQPGALAGRVFLRLRHGVAWGRGRQHGVLVRREAVNGDHQRHAQRQAHGGQAGAAEGGGPGGGHQRPAGVQRWEQQRKDGRRQHHARGEGHEGRFLPLAQAFDQEHGQGAHGGGHGRQERGLHAGRHATAGSSGVPPQAGGCPEGAARGQPGHEQQAHTQCQQGLAQGVRRHGQLQLLHLQPDGTNLADEGGHGGLLGAQSGMVDSLSKTINCRNSIVLMGSIAVRMCAA